VIGRAEEIVPMPVGLAGSTTTNAEKSVSPTIPGRSGTFRSTVACDAPSNRPKLLTKSGLTGFVESLKIPSGFSGTTRPSASVIPGAVPPENPQKKPLPASPTLVNRSCAVVPIAAGESSSSVGLGVPAAVLSSSETLLDVSLAVAASSAPLPSMSASVTAVGSTPTPNNAIVPNVAAPPFVSAVTLLDDSFATRRSMSPSRSRSPDSIDDESNPPVG
jgi:hypothetical protein